MKNFYTLFLFVLCLAKTSLVAQNVNISTKINGFRHNWDCGNDGVNNNEPDIRYKVWFGWNGAGFVQSTNSPGSILQMPQIISFFLEKSTSVTFTGIAAALKNFTSTNIWYMVTYFILIFFFTYFYTAVTFDAESMSNNLQKNGAFVPGIRPGAATAEYVATLLSRTTFFGAIFFAIIAVMPFLLQRLTGNSLFAIGGTGILIGVSVCTDLIKKLGAQASMREY